MHVKLTEELLDFVQRTQQQLQEQDNRATSYPIYEVRDRVRVYGFCDDYAEKYAWFDESDDWAEVKEPNLLARLEAGETDGYDKVHYRTTESTEQFFFTEQAAQAYIDANRHNLADPFVYVSSGYRNYEYQTILSLIEHLNQQVQEQTTGIEP